MLMERIQVNIYQADCDGTLQCFLLINEFGYREFCLIGLLFSKLIIALLLGCSNLKKDAS